VGLVDTSYAPWDAPRQGRARRIAAIVRVGIGLAFEGLLTKLVLILAYSTVILFLGILYIVASLKTPWPMALGNNLYREYLNSRPYGLLLMLLTAIVGARLISRDLAYDALSMYFSKGIRRLDYALAKLAVIAIFLFSATLLPSLLLWLGQIGMGEETLAWADRLSDLGALSAHACIIVLPSSAAILALSSLSRTAYVPGIAWVLVYFGSEVAGAILVRRVRAEWCKLVCWQNLTAHLGNLCYAARGGAGGGRNPRIFRSGVEMTYGWREPALILGAVTLLAFAVLAWRLARAGGRE
jgi:ABC-2 type transport system permease protein